MCTFYLLTPSSPILLSGCDNIVFAPFNSSYSDIENDAYASGLADCLNRWNKPIVVTQNQSLANSGSHWSLMQPGDFTLLTVPVEPVSAKSQTNIHELITKANVGETPKENIIGVMM